MQEALAKRRGERGFELRPIRQITGNSNFSETFITEARAPFEVPRGNEFVARLSSVLQVIYLIFNEGYAATSGDDWMRPALCEEALRLGEGARGRSAPNPNVGCVIVA